MCIQNETMLSIIESNSRVCTRARWINDVKAVVVRTIRGNAPRGRVEKNGHQMLAKTQQKKYDYDELTQLFN